MLHFLCGHLFQRVKILAASMKAAHDQINRATANVVPAAAVIIGYATLTLCVRIVVSER